MERTPEHFRSIIFYNFPRGLSNYINFWPSIFLVLPDAIWHFHSNACHSFSIPILRMFWRTTVICVVYRDLKKLIWQTNGIKSWEFVFDNFLQLLTWINELHTFLAWHISGVARCNLTFPLESLSFFSITILRMFWRTTVNCVVYRDLKKLIWQKNGMNSWAFSFDHFLQLSTWIN